MYVYVYIIRVMFVNKKKMFLYERNSQNTVIKRNNYVVGSYFFGNLNLL